MTIRLAQTGDAPAMIALHYAAVHAIGPDFYDQATLDDWADDPASPQRIGELKARLASGEETALVAEAGAGEILGFASAVLAKKELRAVYVRPTYARSGVGALLKELEKQARAVGVGELGMDASLNAEIFYLAQSYVAEARGEHMSRSGRAIACVKMRKILS